MRKEVNGIDSSRWKNKEITRQMGDKWQETGNAIKKLDNKRDEEMKIEARGLKEKLDDEREAKKVS